MQDEDGLTCTVEKEEVRVVVPRILIEMMMNHVHGSRENGHRGAFKTLTWIKSRFGWKG